ncbi:MAG TPA: hypothetical protein VLA19_16485 [Herpetosiphonaceae bacterium]|nr:hypothetical protein [Herpetosiphonaceae bacterium]
MRPERHNVAQSRGLQTVASVAESTGDEVDLDRLAARLLTVVEETMYPAHVSLWLRDAARPPCKPETLLSTRLAGMDVSTRWGSSGTGCCPI